VNEADSYAGLKLLIVPSAIVMDADRAEKIEAFVSQGGVLLVTATSGKPQRAASGCRAINLEQARPTTSAPF